MKSTLLFSIIYFILSSNSLPQRNWLNWQQKLYPFEGYAYMDKTVLVVEPKNNFVEQSLYINYSDHRGSGTRPVQITHLFELPEGSVVNDLWLWIGDSVMKALVVDRWTAQSIYDSIVDVKHRIIDPAILIKNGRQYELRVYPMMGEYRKIKLKFVSPLIYDDDSALVSLPLKMLQANNNSKKTLEVLFRHSNQDDNLYHPSFLQKPHAQFVKLSDTLGYTYSLFSFDDIKSYNSLELKIHMKRDKGISFSSALGRDSIKYFQLTVHPSHLFKTNDTTAKKIVFAIDLSSNDYGSINLLLDNLRDLLMSSLESKDLFKIILSGEEGIDKTFYNWLTPTEQNIDKIITGIRNHKLFSPKKKPYIFLTRVLDWPELNNLANFKYYSYNYNLSDALKDVDVIFGQHFYSGMTEDSLLGLVDSFFQRGGRLVGTIYPGNHPWENPNKEILTTLIPGFKWYKYERTTFSPNLNGNVNWFSPEPIVGGAWVVSYTDSNISKDLVTPNGDPVVITKKIKEGLLVINNPEYEFPNSILKEYYASIMGLYTPSKNLQLREILRFIQEESDKEKFDKCFLITNHDSLINIAQSKEMANDYLKTFKEKIPSFSSINLLNSSILNFPSNKINDKCFWGAGYFLELISSATNGTHWETNAHSFHDIKLDILSVEREFTIRAEGDGMEPNFLETKEVKLKHDKFIPLKYFVGSLHSSNKVSFTIEAKFDGSDSLYSKVISYPLSNEVPLFGDVIPSLFANEKINDIMSVHPFDTAKVVELGMRYNIMSDYTAMLALEPNDTIHFMKNPFDEGSLNPVEEEIIPDSMDIVAAYPNPFNSQTKILVSVSSESVVKVAIYNILGQLVSVLADNQEFSGRKIFTWNGKSGNGEHCSSGIYFTRVETVSKSTNEKKINTIKLLMLK